MKIVIVGPAYPYRGGIADTNESFCRALNSIGHDASLVTFTVQYPNFLFPGKTQYSTDPVPGDLEINRWINSANPLSWSSSAKKIESLKPDLVIVRYWLPYMAMSLGTIARKLRKSCKVIALCDNIIPHEKRIGDTFLTKYFTKSFDGFITMSGTVKKELESFVSRPNICMAHPINDNLGTKISKSEALNKIGLKDGKYILFFGLVRKYKGLDLTLKALAEKRLKAMNVKLIIAGEFYDDPKEYTSMIEDLGLVDRVIIKNEYIATADIKYYFSAADLVTQTYHTASQSGVTQIAFNFDTPILVTDVGGLSEIVKHNELGYVTEKDPENIAHFIVDFFENERSEKMSKHVEEAKKKYSWEAFGEAVVKMVENQL